MTDDTFEFMGGFRSRSPLEPDLDADSSTPGPVLRVVRGYPTPDELAAVIAVIAAAGGGEPERTPASATSNWAAPSRSMRHHYHPVPGHLTSDSWWQSGMPT